MNNNQIVYCVNKITTLHEPCYERDFETRLFKKLEDAECYAKELALEDYMEMHDVSKEIAKQNVPVCFAAGVFVNITDEVNTITISVTEEELL